MTSTCCPQTCVFMAVRESSLDASDGINKVRLHLAHLSTRVHVDSNPLWLANLARPTTPWCYLGLAKGSGFHKRHCFYGTFLDLSAPVSSLERFAALASLSKPSRNLKEWVAARGAWLAIPLFPASSPIGTFGRGHWSWQAAAFRTLSVIQSPQTNGRMPSAARVIFISRALCPTADYTEHFFLASHDDYTKPAQQDRHSSTEIPVRLGGTSVTAQSAFQGETLQLHRHRPAVVVSRQAADSVTLRRRCHW